MERRVSDEESRVAATRVLDACRSRGVKIAIAESGTGGLVAGALTDIAGSSDVVERGFITYSNEAKAIPYFQANTTSARRSNASAKRRNAVSNIDPMRNPSVRLRNS